MYGIALLYTRVLSCLQVYLYLYQSDVKSLFAEGVFDCILSQDIPNECI
jgi:hypothetical protein